MAIKKKTVSQKNKLDILSIGDSTEDIFVKIDEAKIICDMDETYCWLCIDYQEENEIIDIERTIAGNAANLAVGMSRLGFKSSLYTVVGCDETGEKIRKTLKKEKVFTGHLSEASNCLSNSTLVINYKSERTQLIFHQSRDYKFPKINQKLDWIYLTAMGEGCEKIYPDLEKYLMKNKTKLGFNPGSHQLEAGMESYGRLLELCEVLFVNKEETIELFGLQKANKIKDPYEQMKFLLPKVREFGPEIVVITDGKNGAYSYDGKKYFHLPIFSKKRVEMTGAGDSFSTGFIAAIMAGKSSHDALLWGSFNSTNVIMHIGPQAGLLTKKEILGRLKTNPKYQPIEF